MSSTDGSAGLARVRQVLAARGKPCAVCGRAVAPASPHLRVRGAWFHAGCAGYRPRAARR
jgi:hypothetical protein